MADTHSYYLTNDVAMRLLPALCTMTVDSDKTVRDQVCHVGVAQLLHLGAWPTCYVWGCGPTVTSGGVAQLLRLGVWPNCYGNIGTVFLNRPSKQ